MADYNNDGIDDALQNVTGNFQGPNFPGMYDFMPGSNSMFLGKNYNTQGVAGGEYFRLPKLDVQPLPVNMGQTGPVGATMTAEQAISDTTSGGFGGFKNMSAAQQMQVAGGIGGVIQGLVGRKKRRARQRAAKKEYLKQRDLYQQLDTSNLAAGFKNSFANMENTYEDLTVNQQQAMFMAQQNQQSQANTMEALRGAAGSSGIAGLAQIIANQSQLATQKASASIGLQESRNEMMAAKGAAANQAMERKGEYQQQMMKFQGARESRMLDYQKQEMELGFAMQEKGAADQAVQAANAALYGGIGQLATTALTGGFSPA